MDYDITHGEEKDALTEGIRERDRKALYNCNDLVAKRFDAAGDQDANAGAEQSPLLGDTGRSEATKVDAGAKAEGERESQRLRRERLKQEGKCRCGRKLTSSRKTCRRCRSTGCAKMNDRYKERKNAGCCINCGGLKETVRVRCDKCANRDDQVSKKYYEANLKRRRCTGCGKSLACNEGKKCERCKSRLAGYHRNLREEWRLFKPIVYRHYGSQCVCCGEKDLRFLTIDHVLNDGAAERRKIPKPYFYKYIVENDFPDRYRLLCFNCNCALGTRGVCHGEAPQLSKASEHHRLRVARVLNAYGDKCVCCGESNVNLLTLDHIKGGGRERRKQSGGGTTHYEWAIKNDYPDTLRVLCWNCNTGSFNNGGTCPHLTAGPA